MKKYISLLFVLFFILNMQSQVLITLLLGDKLNSDGLEFGLEGGLNWAQVSGLETNNYARKFNLGFYFDIRLKNQWDVYTGVLVKSNMGIDKLTDADMLALGATIYEDSNGDRLVGNYSHKMNTFLVPVLIKYKFKNYFYAEIGPQFGLMYDSWIEFESDIDGRDATIKEYNKDMINRIDVGAMAGFGYQLLKGKGMQMGVKYYYGFVDVYKDRPGSKNSSFFLKFSVPIGAKKKNEVIED